MSRRASLPTLDPSSFDEFRAVAHKMLDAMIDHVEQLPSGPVWRPMPSGVRAAFDAPVPRGETPLDEVPSTTRIDGKLAIRVAIVNHRCREPDLDVLIDAVLDRAASRR